MENNKLIAQFMEYSRPIFMGGANDDGSFFVKIPDYFHGHVLPTDFKFHSDWNWLMSVVEKIESLGLNFPISIYWHSSIIGDDRVGKRPMLTTDTDNNTGLFFIGKDGSRIENTFTACIEFIKWYNEQNK